MPKNLLLLPVIFFTLFCADTLLADSSTGKPQGMQDTRGWKSFIRGGAVYQFDTDLDDGGSYDSKRFNLQAGYGYSWNRRTGVSFTFGYSYDGYSFSTDGNGTFSQVPWDDIHTFSLGVPVRVGMTEKWSAFIIPSVNSTGESGAEFSDTLTGGVLTGFSYRFGDRLTIGPGIGVVSQLEESATVFPILLINWKITDKLSLETGRGLAATLGPGLTLKYALNQRWNFGIGGRYEKLRFRLDDDDSNPDGIGENSSVPLFINCTYRFDTRRQISIVGGVELDGELIMEDKDGNSIVKSSTDEGLFGGVTFSMRF